MIKSNDLTEEQLNEIKRQFKSQHNRSLNISDGFTRFKKLFVFKCCSFTL